MTISNRVKGSSFTVGRALDVFRPYIRCPKCGSKDGFNVLINKRTYEFKKQLFCDQILGTAKITCLYCSAAQMYPKEPPSPPPPISGLSELTPKERRRLLGI